MENMPCFKLKRFNFIIVPQFVLFVCSSEVKKGLIQISKGEAAESEIIHGYIFFRPVS